MDKGQEYKLVPIEPTLEMGKAGYTAYNTRYQDDGGEAFWVMTAYRAMIAAAPTFDTVEQSQWIATNERLPEEPGIYLIMLDYQNDLGTIWTMDMASFGDGEWHKAYNVTHWMPLPAKPVF